MRAIIAVMLLLSPALGAALAQATSLTDKSLAAYRSNCVQRCAQKHDRTTCRSACRCMSDEMQQHWTLERYNRYAATLKKHPKDRRTNHMMQQMADYCFEKAHGR